MEERKRNLSDIVQDFLALLNVMDETDGTESDLHGELDAIEAELSAKVQAAINVVITLEATATAERERAARVVAHSRALEAHATRLRGWVESCLLAADIREMKAGDYTVKLAKRPASVVLDEPTFLAWAAAERPELLRFRDPEPDKKAIGAALKEGEVLPGAGLLTDGVSLRWR